MLRMRIALLICSLSLICGCSTGRTEVDYQLIQANYGVDDPQFRQTVMNLLGPPLLPGNSITTYINGDAFYPPMLAAIAAAKKTITFETFIYWKGQMGEAFTTALCERARAGVKVHVTIDAVGSDHLDCLQALFPARRRQPDAFPRPSGPHRR